MKSMSCIQWPLPITNSLDRSAPWCLLNVSNLWVPKNRSNFSWKKPSTMKSSAVMLRPRSDTDPMSEVSKPLPHMTKQPNNLSLTVLQFQPLNFGPDNLDSSQTGPWFTLKPSLKAKTVEYKPTSFQSETKTKTTFQVSNPEISVLNSDTMPSKMDSSSYQMLECLELRCLADSTKSRLKVNLYQKVTKRLHMLQWWKSEC